MDSLVETRWKCIRISVCDAIEISSSRKSIGNWLSRPILRVSLFSLSVRAHTKGTSVESKAFHLNTLQIAHSLINAKDPINPSNVQCFHCACWSSVSFRISISLHELPNDAQVSSFNYLFHRIRPLCKAAQHPFLPRR